VEGDSLVTMAKDKALEAVGVSKSFSSKKVLNLVDLKFDKGEIMCLMGPTGSGKTTFLRILAGLERADAGEIDISGKKVAGDGVFVPAHMRGVGVVFQGTALWPHMSVLENIEFGLKGGEQHLINVVEYCKLTDLIHRYPSTLSGGQRQLVEIARALASKPEMLLFDEPLSNLDWMLKRKLLKMISGLSSDFKTSILYVTHDQIEAKYISDKVAVMYDGRILQSGTFSALRKKPTHPFVKEFISPLIHTK
jgi:ABC-type sugar transport system ATPase subunit